MWYRIGSRLLLIALLVSAVPPLAGCARRQYNKGNDAMDQGETAEAIGHYQKAVGRKPDNPDYQFALGQALLRAGAYPKAITAFTRASEIEPERVELLEQLAFAYVKVGEVDPAIDVYWRLFGLQQHPWATYEKLRPLLESRERYKESADAAVLASKAPKFDAAKLTEIGKEYQRRGHPKEADTLYQRALEINPKQAALWRLLGELRLRSNDGAGAADAYQKAYKLEPTNDQAALGAAEALRRIGQTDEALRLYEQVADRNPEMIEPRIGMTELYLALGDADKASITAREAYIRQPEDPVVQALKGASHLARGEYDKAIYALDRASRHESGATAWVIRMMGDAMVGMGERATARQYYSRAIGRDPEEGGAWLGLCRLDLEDDREEQGIERCQKAMLFAPELRDDAVDLMTAYYERIERLAKAAEVVEKAPPPPRATRRSPRAGSGSGGSKAATAQQIAHFRELHKELMAIPEEARTGREWYELGDLSLKLDDLETAEKALTRAWQAETENLQYRKKMAKVLLVRGKYDSALVHFKEIIRDDERDVDARFALVQAYLGRGSAGDALEVLRELREIAPNDPRVYELSAEASFDLGMEGEGEKYQREAIARRSRQK